MLAAFKLRAVPVNVNYRYVATELALRLRQCGSGRDPHTARVRADDLRYRA